MVPNEQKVHKAALFMSLLEQYDPGSIDPAQAEVLACILAYIANNPQAVSYFARYDLEERAARYLRSCRRPPQSAEAMHEPLRTGLLQSYRDCIKAQLDLPVHDLDASSTVATDLEMQADLAMQLRKLNEMPGQDRIIQAVSDNTSLSSHERVVQTALENVWKSERTLLAENPIELQNFDAQLDNLAPEVRRVLQQVSETRTTETTRPVAPLQNLPPQQRQQSPVQGPVQHDELAQTAAELLDKVSHDQSAKFQNSTFLDLMRKLKNREVQVEGDEMVTVCKPYYGSSHKKSTH